ncbi:hypothetical protein Vadar_021135 [Vaccinium darrowii]|uniref:Uncharacterized protein n=1 Tax=Vaccinium darrowii TaxID=229202 RepID=A0ACB7ZN15_9ERIC|nr:hypothetical protein Vadar_021135 [Vaccinium darrowii]
MKHMMPEIHKANEMVLDATSECNYPICRTHGLPCAHEIAKFKNDGIPLPLYLINNHWKTLSLGKPKHDDSIVQVMEATFNNFLAKVKTFNDKSQRHWMETIKECLHPSTTSLSDPQQKPKTKDRPIGSLNTSTRRDPSEFEYVEATMKTPQAKEKTPKLIKVKTPEVVKEKTPKVVKENPRKKLKVVASLFRNVLLMELNEHLELYENVSGEKGEAEQLHHRLTYFDDFPAPEYTWTTMPNMGYLIASTYNVVVVFLSQRQCLTFLPLRSRSLARQRKVIAIGFVNGNHFVQVYMKARLPMPPVANNWYKYRHDEAKGWEKPFVSQIADFIQLIGCEVAIVESCDVD